MLTFFRKIRKSLAGASATKKYLLYAVGEIMLVMIGILLALQVNNWNEWRKDRITEKRTLEDLVENLELNVTFLNERVKTNLKSDRSSEIIASFLEERLPYNDTLERHFGWGLTIEHVGSISSVGYETLKNVGIEIIKNRKLKKEIIFLFEETYKNTHTRIDRIEPSNIEITKVRQGLFMRKPGFKFEPFDYKSLLEDKIYKSWLLTIKNNRQWLNYSIENSLEETERVLQLIKDELGKANT